MVWSKYDVTPRTTTSLNTNILGQFQDTEISDQHFHDSSVLGKINHLENINGPDIVYAAHQYAKLYEDPIRPHGEAVKRIGRYLKVPDKMGINTPPRDSDVKVWADADFSSNIFWRKLRMIHTRHVLARYLLHYIWGVHLCENCNSRQRFPSDILIVSILYSVNNS